MQTVILAAGEGTRMRPLTESSPKPMLPVADRPLAAHVADAAVLAGATRLIFVIGYRGTEVRKYFGTEFRGVPVSYVEQADPQGTADAVRFAADELVDEPFVVLNGDVLTDPEAVTGLYQDGPAVGGTRVDQPSRYGVLERGADEPTVERVIEKPADPPSNLINAGMYAFPAGFADRAADIEPSERGEYELTDLLNTLCDETDVRLVSIDRWLDVGRPWDLLEANEWKIDELTNRIDGNVSPNATINGDVVIENGATIRDGVTIDGPVFIRENATIGPNAYLRGGSLIGRGATVGHAVEVKNSVLFPEASVSHQSYVGDSLLGEGVNFGAGTHVANLRHDETEVKVSMNGQRVSTGRRKFGVVVGPRVKTGIGTLLNAGVVLAADETTIPGEQVLRSRGPGSN